MNPLRIPRTILACVGVVIDTAVQMRTQQRDYEAAVRAAAPKSEREPVEAEAERPPDSAASATAAPSPAIPPASDTDPVGVVDGPPASATPAGPPSELAELIAAVLDAHEGHYNRASSVFECVEYHADGGLRRVPVGDDYQGWLRHVAPLIAERIEKAAPPAGLTPDDLRLAASAIYGHALAPYLRPNQATEFARLADRLHELAEHTP